MNQFTAAEDFARFTSKIDKKGRVLVSADTRKLLGLRFGIPVEVLISEKKFYTKVDERGRFSVPARLRKGSEVSGAIIVRGGVMARTAGCGPAGPGPIPGRGPISWRSI